MEGKLFIIEGLDGSGKETQTKRLYERLISENINVRKVEYPNYKSDSSALVKMYLNGDFGTNVDDVDAYVSSTFYAVDRYASYKTEWEEFYKNGGIILADRYTSSNMIHQTSKIEDKKEQQRFLDWLDELEFGIYKLPRPNNVIFINMPLEYSKRLMEKEIIRLQVNLKRIYMKVILSILKSPIIMQWILLKHITGQLLIV